MNIDIIRAWKDEDYRNSLSKEELAQLPESPVGEVELSDEDLGVVVAGMRPSTAETQCAQDGCTQTAQTYWGLC